MAPTSRTTRPSPELEGRTDLRELPTLTVDPETAKDYDDALSIIREGDGLRAYVHIADVSYFVPAGTPLDRGAADRSCSVYVPGRVAPMLPSELADDLCSLRPNQERLTVTVEIPFGSGLKMGTPSFYRSVIRSDARLDVRTGRAGTGRHGAARRRHGRDATTRRAARRRASPPPVRPRSPADRSRRGRVRLRRRGRRWPTRGWRASRMPTCSSRS